MTPSETAKLVAMLMQAYPQAQFAPASARMYERALADLGAEATLGAVQRLIATSKWMPTIAEIRATAAELGHGPKRLGAEGWGDVVEAIRYVGSYRPAPAFTDPIVAECVRLMGWRNLCLGDNDVADRARFIELYDGLAARERTNTIAAPGLLPAPRPEPAPAWLPARRQAAPLPVLPMPRLDLPKAPAASSKPAQAVAPRRERMSAAELDALLEGRTAP